MIILTALSLILLVVSVIILIREYIVLVKRQLAVAGMKAQKLPKKDKKIKITELILICIALLLVIFQIVVCLTYSFNGNGNLRYLKSATAFYDSGAITGADGLMVLWGMISKVLGIHPMLFVFSILPIVMIPFYYLAYYLLLTKLTDGTVQNVITGIIVIEILNIWGYQSDLLIPVTMLMSYATMTSFIVHAFLPLVLFEILNIREKIVIHKFETEEEITEGQESGTVVEDIDDEDYQEEWDMKKHKIINARNLAIALGVLALALVAFVFILNNKINTLHAATANLQRDLSERTRIYEFVSDSGKVEGYLIKGSDGELTMIGGGNVDNAEELNVFLGEYGTNITNWYLYEADEENMGAYAKCTLEKGITVENVYVLNRTQIEGLN